MKYVHVPRDLHTREVLANEACFSPGRYVRFMPPIRAASHYAPLDKLVVVREDLVKVQKSEQYRYAEIGDINVATGGIAFHEKKGYQLPAKRLAGAQSGDVLISTVRTYRKGIGLVTDEGKNLVTTNALLNLCATTGVSPGITLPYVYAFLRSDFFVEQVWSLLHRGVYPRMDTGALGKILLPVADSTQACDYVAALAIAIADKERAIRLRHEEGLLAIHLDLLASETSEFDFNHPTSHQVLEATRLDAGFWSEPLRRQIHRLATYRAGSWPSIYAAGFTTRRGQNLQISAVGKGYYSERPFGAALPLATPGDISDFMTIPKLRYYGNRRSLDLVRKGEIIFAAKGVREVSIGHTWVNLGDSPLVTNIDAFLIHSPQQEQAIFLAFLFGYLKRVGVFAKLSDTSNGGSFVRNYFEALPIPKVGSDVVAKVAKLYHRRGAPPARGLTLENFVAWHRQWNENLGIWELDQEMKILQKTLSDVQEEIIEGRTVKLPF